MIKIDLNEKQAQDLEDFVSKHMLNCYELLYDTDADLGEWEPYSAFDGCDTCETRENIMAVFDWLRKNGLADIGVV